VLIHLLFLWQLSRIAELAAPTIYQNAKMSAKGRPDIQPILMACPPRTKEEVAAEAALEADQQNGQAGNNQAPDH
jgi:hypothetical protein